MLGVFVPLGSLLVGVMVNVGKRRERRRSVAEDL